MAQQQLAVVSRSRPVILSYSATALTALGSLSFSNHRCTPYAIYPSAVSFYRFADDVTEHWLRRSRALESTYHAMMTTDKDGSLNWWSRTNSARPVGWTCRRDGRATVSTTPFRSRKRKSESLAHPFPGDLAEAFRWS